MSDLFLHLLNMSLTASWMILAVLLLRLVLKKAPRWIPCLLWGVVALRLILPFSLESALSLIPSAEPIPPDIAVTDTPAIDTGIPVINETVNPIIHETFTPPVENTGATPMQTLLGVVSIVWVAGVGLMLLYSLFSYLRLYAKVRASLRREANVYYCDAIAYPFILGIFRPRIYVPSGMPEDQVGYILRHERAHLARRDHWWKPLGFLLLSVYWFNPIIWVGYILLCRDIEMACDEKVIKDMSGAAKVGYSEALVACSMQRRMILACPLAFGEVGVKQRIRSVLNYKKPAFWILLTAIVASIAVTICFCTDPKKNDSLYGDVSASKLTDAQAQELLSDLVERQIELEFLFADESPAADSSQTHPLDQNLWLSTDERFSSIQDIRDMILAVMTEEAAEALYFHYLDGPFDSIEDGPEFLEYEGKLYVNMYAGGKGFSTTYLFDTARIVERTRNSVTVEMNTQFVDLDDAFIYTPTLVKTKDGWRLDSSLGEGYNYESANELSLSEGEAPADSIRFTDTTVPEQNYTLLIQTSRTVTDLRLLALTDSDTISSSTLYRVQQTLYTLDTLTPEDTLALATYVNDATVNRAISYRDDKGVLRHYAIRCDMSGQKESPYLEELAFYEVEYDETSGSSSTATTTSRPSTSTTTTATTTTTTTSGTTTTTTTATTTTTTASTTATTTTKTVVKVTTTTANRTVASISIPPVSENNAIIMIRREEFYRFLQQPEYGWIVEGTKEIYSSRGIYFKEGGSVRFPVNNTLFSFAQDEEAIQVYLSQNGINGQVEGAVIYDAPNIPLTMWVKTTEENAFLVIETDQGSFDNISGYTYKYTCYDEVSYRQKYNLREALLLVNGKPVQTTFPVLIQYRYGEVPLAELLVAFGATVQDEGDSIRRFYYEGEEKLWMDLSNGTVNGETPAMIGGRAFSEVCNRDIIVDVSFARFKVQDVFGGELPRVEYDYDNDTIHFYYE